MRNANPKIVAVFALYFLVAMSAGFADMLHASVEKYNLSNGLTVIIEPDHSSSLVCVQFCVRTGSGYEGRFLGSGISHLLEHLVFSHGSSSSNRYGSKNRVSQELRDLGGELDAGTSKEYTQYYITVGKDKLDKTLELLYGLISRIEFDDDEFKKEKEVIAHEMDFIEDDPSRCLVDQFYRTAYCGHPFGEPIIGNKTLFSALTADDVKNYHKEQYVPRNMVLIVVGDINPVGIKTTIENTWGKLTDKYPAQIYLSSRPEVKGPVKSVVRKRNQSTSLVLGFYGPSVNSLDMYAMDLLAEIAGGGKSSRLVKILRDKLGIVTNISAWSYTPSVTGIWGVSANIIGKDWGLTTKAILKEIIKLRCDGCLESELRKAKKRMLNSHYNGMESLNGKASDLFYSEFYARNPLYGATYINGILKTTKEDILRCAREYLRKENRVESVLLPESDDRESGISADYMAGRDVIKKELPNRMRVILCKDDRVPLALIRIAARGGVLDEGIPGVSYFLSQLWLKENQKVVKDIEDAGGNISAYSGNNSFGVTIKVSSVDAKMALDNAKKMITGMTITPEKYELVRKIQLAEIKQEMDDPYGFALREVKKLFFENHPYSNSILGTEESVNSVKEKDLKDIFNRYTVPSEIVLGVFGDVDTKNIFSYIEGTYGAIPARPFLSEKNNYKIVEKVEEKTLVRGSDQAIIMLAYPGINIYDRDKYAVELLVEYLSGQAGILYEGVREESGLSYSVGAVNYSGVEKGALIIYAATSPDKVELVKSILYKQIARAKSKDMPGKELDGIKNYHITETENAWQSMGGFSSEIMSDELYGLGVDYYKQYLDNIRKVTAADIKAAANKYFKDNWRTQLVVMPGKDTKVKT